jgi:hypothetical protein
MILRALLSAQTTRHAPAYLAASCTGASAVAMLAVCGHSTPHRSLPSAVSSQYAFLRTIEQCFVGSGQGFSNGAATYKCG